MKKTFLGLMALCAVFAFTSCKDKAASSAEGTDAALVEETGIKGIWVADAKSMMENAGEDVAKMCEKSDLMMVIDDDNVNMSFDFLCSANENGLGITMGIKASFESAYTSTDNTITCDYTKSTPKVDLYKFEIDADEQTKAMLEAAGMSEESMQEMFKAQMTPENFKDMTKTLNNTINYEQPDNNTLILIDEKGQKVEFTRK